MEKTIEPVSYVREWSIDRIHELAESENTEDYLNAIAISEEFDEWINLPYGLNEINCLVIEREGFTEQEIDTFDM
jgi:hypothetical protein